jgi:Ala-tRNA(Pro) deacylase
MSESQKTYDKLIELLDAHQADYRLIDHEPEGRTEIVSSMRGHPTQDAVKCMIVMIKIGKKVTRFVLAVIPGDRRVNISMLQKLYAGTFARFAETSAAEKLAGSVSGTVLPFSFNTDLEIIVDPAIQKSDFLYFNAARLDRSVALRTVDYLAIAKPRLESISTI